MKEDKVIYKKKFKEGRAEEEMADGVYRAMFNYKDPKKVAYSIIDTVSSVVDERGEGMKYKQVLMREIIHLAQNF